MLQITIFIWMLFQTDSFMFDEKNINNYFSLSLEVLLQLNADMKALIYFLLCEGKKAFNFS